MITISSVQDMKNTINSYKMKGKSIGFVPTMGFLHEGHLSLVAQSVIQCDITVMSIFVNPLQFGPGEDFERYPRDIERDRRLAEEAGVDLLFYPDVTELYPSEPSVKVMAVDRTDVLCGASRPGHFDGVVTVLSILFNIVDPDKSFFGQKDAQQVAVVEGLAKSLHFPTEIIPVETVREEDGLAKSSRNVYLSDQERKEAPAIYQALQLSSKVYLQSGRMAAIDHFKNELLSVSGELDYVEILTYPELQVPSESDTRLIIAAAVRFERARLIDNIIFTTEEEPECSEQ
ncbi:pantoate--beta-alanine ligase [Jeotgalibacillus haloalkalitolerans]|uniref:Pantothenate synthetase n=1 Tax=Jeotgalibacillus haloalkalitolerans TaxID=3104292 RepID=A0ABU5KL44_9BACL|nr:pantoate--beta-alanine ligase [Jeotgalibacillus sp. HH7-29]MDZ5711987.1 pantoate--beta-alanine ligase [Jeotgalibacillus sp. HH7-29]